MAIEHEIAAYLISLDDRVSRLETLEQQAGGGGGGGDLFLIETVGPLTVNGIIQISGIPATAKGLFYTGFVRSLNGTSLALVINTATTATDLSSLLIASCAGGATGLTTFGNVRMGLAPSNAGIGIPADIFSALMGWVPDIQDTTNKTGTIARSGYFSRDDFVHNVSVGRGGGNWDKAAAITQVDLVHDGGNIFVIGSVFSLYGIVDA